MTRVGRAGTGRLFIAIIVALALSASATAAGAILFQDEPPVEIGAGPTREPSLSLIGRATYTPDTVTVFGYFTALKGLDPSLLFAAAPASESSARFTYSGEIALNARVDRGDVTSIGGEGLVTIYRNDAGGASWNDPASFANGQELATLDMVLRETMHRQGPGAALVIGDNSLTLASTQEFSAADETYRFGRVGLPLRLRTMGATIAVDPARPPTVAFTGTGAVSARETTPIPIGPPGTPAAAAGTQTEACGELALWLGETQSRLERADELSTAPGVAGAIEAIDSAVVRAAADEVAVLATSQRSSAVPAGADEASRLAVTSLSTYARGLQSVSDGAAGADADQLAQGQLVVADGQRLSERARDALAALAASCQVTGETGRDDYWLRLSA